MTITPINLMRRVATGLGVLGLAWTLMGACPASAATPLAQSHLNYAIDLGRRGAVYSAQSEFTQVLHMVAQTLDTGATTQQHSTALATGLAAFTEADDFSAAATQRDGALDLSRRIATHRTPILKNADMTRLTPLAAMQAYYNYGKEQLAAAAEHDRSASAALYGLARLQGVMSGRNAGPKAVALHQAALMVNPENYLAANELGVLLFRYGQAEDARSILQHSVRMAPRSETWHNLEVVCAELGRRDEAQAAHQQWAAALAAEKAQGEQGGDSNLVYWVEKEKLENAPADATWDTPSNGAGKTPVTPVSAPLKKSERSISSLLPWSSKESK